MEGKSGLSWLGIVIFGLGILAVFAVLATTRVNEHEKILYCIILTLFSLGLGFLLSALTSNQRISSVTKELEQRHLEELKTHAVKTADNVDNLSGELQRFARFLEGELQNQYKDLAEGFRSRTERIESSVHIINTLRSVNNASLSDWRSVIPERVVDKREAREEVKYPSPQPTRLAEAPGARLNSEAAARPPLKPTGGVA